MDQVAVDSIKMTSSYHVNVVAGGKLISHVCVSH